MLQEDSRPGLEVRQRFWQRRQGRTCPFQIIGSQLVAQGATFIGSQVKKLLTVWQSIYHKKFEGELLKMSLARLRNKMKRMFELENVLFLIVSLTGLGLGLDLANRITIRYDTYHNTFICILIQYMAFMVKRIPIIYWIHVTWPSLGSYNVCTAIPLYYLLFPLLRT